MLPSVKGNGTTSGPLSHISLSFPWRASAAASVGRKGRIAILRERVKIGVALIDKAIASLSVVVEVRGRYNRETSTKWNTRLFYNSNLHSGAEDQGRCDSLPIFHYVQILGQAGDREVVLIRQLESVPPIQLA